MTHSLTRPPTNQPTHRSSFHINQPSFLPALRSVFLCTLFVTDQNLLSLAIGTYILDIRPPFDNPESTNQHKPVLAIDIDIDTTTDRVRDLDV